jgi:hypothetical protein
MDVDVGFWLERIRHAPDDELLEFHNSDYLGVRSFAAEKASRLLQQRL